MANASQIISLIKSHFDSNEERFSTLALQIAAHEAKLGHSALAFEIRDLLNKQASKKIQSKVVRFQPNLAEVLLELEPKNRLSEMVLSDDLKSKVERILMEFRQKSKLQKHGLTNRRKILLAGLPGTGKTLTASVIAAELHLPLYSVLLDKIVTKYLGETSAKLRQVFDFIEVSNGVFLFDEFDAIGTERSKENDVGEMRRVLNSFLQFIERNNSESLIIAATNNISLLDNALFRRFDDILTYKLPSDEECFRLIKYRLGSLGKGLDFRKLEKDLYGLSHAQITQACDDAIKEVILSNLDKVDGLLLNKYLNEKKSLLQQIKNE
jgi:SpoVK/Ycf46/Vps4 family AAA+-type ATPase